MTTLTCKNCSSNGVDTVILNQLKREIDELSKTTETTLLRHDGKIADLVNYIKDNLSLSIANLLDSMLSTGELDEIITEALTSELAEATTKLDGLYSVKNFGALGDGTTDDTKAIQSAIDYVEKHSGILYFNPGIYIISDSLKITKPIKIMGINEKGLVATGSYYGPHIKQVENANIFDFTGSNDYYGVSISGIRLSGKNIAINIDTTGSFSEFIFEKIHFNGGFEKCIFFDKTGSIGRISDCDFSANKIGIDANTLVSVTINENNFWENSEAHIKFGSCEDLRIMNNWFEKVVESGCSLLLQAPFKLNKCIFLNNEFRSTKTPIIYYDCITDITGTAYVMNTKFENCRFSPGSDNYAIIVRTKENEVSNSNGNNSSKIKFDNCLFVNVKTSAIYTDYKWLYWNLNNCECFSNWTSGNKPFVTGDTIITNTNDITGFKTNGYLEFEEISNTSLVKDGIMYKANDGNIKIFKYGSGKTLMTCLSGGKTQRPTTGLTAGMMYYDTTLAKPVFYNGNKWVDATGNDA